MSSRVIKEPEVRRQEIIDSARQLFEQQGIQKTSVQEISNRIGVAKGLVYYYFASKEELVTAVITQFSAGVATELEQILQSDQLDYHQKFAAFLAVYFQAIAANPAIFTVSAADPGLFSLFREQLSNIAIEQASTLLEQGRQQGLIVVRYPEYMLKMLVRGLGDLYLDGIHDPAVFAALVEQSLGIRYGSSE